MILKINKIILYSMIVLFLISIYRLILFSDFYPYGLLLLLSFLSIGNYFSLKILASINDQTFLVMSYLSIVITGLLTLGFFYPSFLKLTWNIDLALSLIIIFSAIIFEIKKVKRPLAKIAAPLFVFIGTLIISSLTFKLTNPIWYKFVLFVFLVNSIILIFLFGSLFKKRS